MLKRGRRDFRTAKVAYYISMDEIQGKVVLHTLLVSFHIYLEQFIVLLLVQVRPSPKTSFNKNQEMPASTQTHPVTLSSTLSSSSPSSTSSISMFFLHAFLPLRLACVRCAGAPTFDFAFFFFACSACFDAAAFDVEAFVETAESAIMGRDGGKCREQVFVRRRCLGKSEHTRTNN